MMPCNQWRGRLFPCDIRHVERSKYARVYVERREPQALFITLEGGLGIR
jgi:hypothetical protein